MIEADEVVVVIPNPTGNQSEYALYCTDEQRWANILTDSTLTLLHDNQFGARGQRPIPGLYSYTPVGISKKVKLPDYVIDFTIKLGGADYYKIFQIYHIRQYTMIDTVAWDTSREMDRAIIDQLRSSAS